MNAKQELLKHIGDRGVKYVHIVLEGCVVIGGKWGDNPQTISGTLDEVLPGLDFDYDSGYGGQELFGHVWYTDGTWSERGEYDGSEWWEYKKCPEIPAIQKETP